MNKLILLITSILILVIFFGCDKSDVEPDNQRNQIDIRDSIVGEYYGTGNGSSWAFLSWEAGANTSSWNEDSVLISISKDSLNGLIINCDKLHFISRFDIHEYPFIKKDNSGKYIYGCELCVCESAHFFCTYDPSSKSIVFDDFFFCSNLRVENTVVINQ